MSPTKRPVRIAGCSGAATDRRNAMHTLAVNCFNDPIDVIIGDWMSEANMTARAAQKTGDARDAVAYEPTFLEALKPALPHIARYGIRVVVNAGAADPKRLHDVVVQLIRDQRLRLTVAYISGDEVLPAVQAALREGKSWFENLCTGKGLSEWGFEPIYAQAYLGGFGIAKALERGADVVVCGRVSDASLVVGTACWWHGWERSDLDRLANALIAGHLIECSSYVCGGNFTGFKSLEDKHWDDIGYPVAEIASSGQVVISKSKGSGGEVSVGTCTSQLLYEIQGPWYFNSDVTAILGDIAFEQLESNRVALYGVKSGPPPPTTKVGITAPGGYQAEMHWFLVGLDIEAKARMMETQIRRLLRPYSHRFSKLIFTKNGFCPPNPTSQNAATVDFRVFVQAPKAEYINPQCFLRPCIDPIMEGYPGATFHLDLRQGFPKPVYEYFVTLLPQADVHHKVHLGSEETLDILPPTVTRTYPAQQPSSQTAEDPVALHTFGRTERGPLGWIVHARSGDKGSNCNVGFWVPHKEEYDWLRSLLSVDKIRELLGQEDQGKKIDRFELPNLHAVHFLLHDHLDRGVSCSSTYDFLGKNVAEFLRARHVDMPANFLSRGKL